MNCFLLSRASGDGAGYVFEFYEALGFALAGFEVDAGGVDGGAGVHGLELADHLVGGIDAGFGLGGAGFGAAAEPLDLGADLVAEAFLLAALRFEIGLLFFEEAAEGSFDAEEAVGEDAVELDDLAGGGFKKVAIVADGDGGEGGGAEQLFKPLNTGQVEVVGGLVEEHDFRFDDHGLGDGEPLAPTAGERGCFSVEVGKAGAAGELTKAAFAFGVGDMGCGEGLFKYLADGEAGGEAGILGDVGGAGALADG